ncbi:hypothetical protein PMIN02_010006 [Paraphaeosphaeria minitans]
MLLALEHNNGGNRDNDDGAVEVDQTLIQDGQDDDDVDGGVPIDQELMKDLEDYNEGAAVN